MITAKEAREKALLQPSFKKYMAAIENCINNAVGEGRLYTTIRMCFEEDETDMVEDLRIAIGIELRSFGYEAHFTTNGYLTIKW